MAREESTAVLGNWPGGSGGAGPGPCFVGRVGSLCLRVDDSLPCGGWFSDDVHGRRGVHRFNLCDERSVAATV